MSFDKARPGEVQQAGTDAPQQVPSHPEERHRLFRQLDAMDDVDERELPDRIRPAADRIIAIYARMFNRTVQEARDQVRDPDRLEAAVARPAMYHRYQGADLALEAAVLAHGIAEGQVFVDGNKRTALVAMRTFLRANGYVLDASQDHRFRWMVGLSQGLTPERLADELCECLRPADDPERG